MIPVRGSWAARREGLVVALVLTAAAIGFAVHARGIDGDWEFFVGISRRLFGPDGLAVYADHTNIQTGPLTLIAVRGLDWLGSDAFPLAIVVLGLLTLWCVARMRPERALRGALLLGGLTLLAWWPYLKTSGHLDDAMVLTLAAATVMLVLRDRRIAAAVVVGVALAVKPWSIFLLPITLRRVSLRSREALVPLVSVVVGGALWSPFVLTHPGALRGLSPTVWLAPDSVLRLFGGSAADLTSTMRTVQLLLALALATGAVARDRTAGVLLVGIAARMALDGGTWNYYTVGFVLGALIWDLCGARTRLPWTTLAACVLLPPTWLASHAVQLRSILRLAACLCAVAVVFWPERPTRRADRALIDGRSESDAERNEFEEQSGVDRVEPALTI